MQYQGTDGLSRGSTDAGVLCGDDMISFISLHLSTLDRHPPLAAWIHSWYSVDSYSWLKPFDWFNSGHANGHHVWCPPPAAADVALEQLTIAIHKRPKTQHLLLISRLMSDCWGNCVTLFLLSLWAPLCGLLIILHLLLLAFIFLSLDTDNGGCEALLYWTMWWANCQICQGMLSIGEGILCTNFSAKRRPWTPCHPAWHGK